jgi:DnaJ family protein B protein 12
MARDASGAKTASARALETFEGKVEYAFKQHLYSECQRGVEHRERRKEAEVGIFGIGTDWEKVKAIEKEQIPSCEEFRALQAKERSRR